MTKSGINQTSIKRYNGNVANKNKKFKTELIANIID